MAGRDAALPLKLETPVQWARQVLAKPLELLNDHAHLEKKAATNALELLNRWPKERPPESWVEAMTAVARDEVEHLAVVCRILARRGGKLTKGHANPYATDLRKLVRVGDGNRELVDRLLISGLIEARSCERFKLLATACLAEGEPTADLELGKLYRGLWASEHGHYLTFVALAEEVGDPREVKLRWEWMLGSEAVIMRKQTEGPRMHSGCT
jgi:tRNA 2-(methylsulfanyl)-N6-isopentenyladenosine37 hydroxylase